jgi:hypothetical protein
VDYRQTSQSKNTGLTTNWWPILLDHYNIGSDGDLLNIYYRPDDAPKEHIASLQWGTILGYAYTSIGVCFAS